MLGVSFLEADRNGALSRLASRLGEHRRREVNTSDPMTAARQFEAQEPRAAAGVERIERTSPLEGQIEDAVPGGALGGVRMLSPKPSSNPARRPRMRRDLLLYEVRLAQAHPISLL